MQTLDKSIEAGQDLRLVTDDGLFAVDSRQTIVYWSTSAERIVGYRPEEVLGRPCYEVLAGRESRNYGFCRRNCPVMVNARRGRPTPAYDILYNVPAGGEKWLNVSIAIPQRPRNDFLVLHLFRDVSHRRRTEEFARKAGSALRQLLNQEKGDGAEVEVNPTPVPRLSRRELEVLRLLTAGLSTRRIAETLAIQPVTARNHVTRLITKLGVENRLQAVVYASQHRLI